MMGTQVPPQSGATPALVLLGQARQALAQAAVIPDAGERFCRAHLAALRSAAALLAERGRPAAARRRLISVWVLMDAIAPELSEWAAYFAAGASVRAAVEAGAQNAVSLRAADDQVRAAAGFLDVVESALGLLAAPMAS